MGFEKGRCHCGRIAEEDCEQPQSPRFHRQERPGTSLKEETKLTNSGSLTALRSTRVHVLTWITQTEESKARDPFVTGRFGPTECRDVHCCSLQMPYRLKRKAKEVQGKSSGMLMGTSTLKVPQNGVFGVWFLEGNPGTSEQQPASSGGLFPDYQGMRPIFRLPTLTSYDRTELASHCLFDFVTLTCYICIHLKAITVIINPHTQHRHLFQYLLSKYPLLTQNISVNTQDVDVLCSLRGTKRRIERCELTKQHH